MPTHRHHCPGCSRRAPVVMDVKVDSWVYTRHINPRTGDWCAQSGRGLP